ncbi:MAG: hypothetical protein H7843_09180 [Nitrospirota bacterium]
MSNQTIPTYSLRRPNSKFVQCTHCDNLTSSPTGECVICRRDIRRLLAEARGGDEAIEPIKQVTIAEQMVNLIRAGWEDEAWKRKAT